MYIFLSGFNGLTYQFAYKPTLSVTHKNRQLIASVKKTNTATMEFMWYDLFMQLWLPSVNKLVIDIWGCAEYLITLLII